MTVNEYIAKNAGFKHAGGYTFKNLTPMIECADGWKVSAQASHTHYSDPREDNGPYTHIELGYPSAEESDIMEWAETPSEPTSTVYGYVPVEVVDAVLAKHGGIANGLDAKGS